MQDPGRVAGALRDYLAERLGPGALSFGATLAPMTVAAWLSERSGVERIAACELAAGSGPFSAQMASAPPDGLLRFDPAGSEFAVERHGSKP
jgi:hypothetical protein